MTLFEVDRLARAEEGDLKSLTDDRDSAVTGSLLTSQEDESAL